MATMNISLPDPMKEWVESQTHDGRYANHSYDGSELDIEKIKRIAHLKIKEQHYT